MNQSVTQFWYILEQLVPFDLTKKIEESKHESPISFNDDSTNLPWLDPTILPKKFKLPLYNEKDELIEYNYRVYLGVFPLQLVFDFLESLPKPVAPAFQDLETSSKNLSCFASFKIAHKGLLIDETLNCSTVPWSLRQVQTAFTSKKKFSLDGWTDEYDKHLAHQKLLFSSVAKVNTKANHKIAVNDLEELYKSICLAQNQWCPDKLTYLGYYTVQQRNNSDNTSTDSDNTSTDVDIINSFYLKDLEEASAKANSNTNSRPLSQYLAGSLPKRVPIENRTILQHYLSPKYLPSGRWPSDPTHNLSLMQQCAVNIALETLGQTSGIFSVNGPPGTGKTTLLRDVISDLIVQRAERLIKYEDPSQAFSEQDGIYCPDSVITGFEIVVASSNNGAVENITTELPSLDAIYKDYKEQATYFRKVAESVKVKAQENQQDELDECSTIQESYNQAVWGLIAAVLGNKDNRNCFCEGFWWDKQNSIKFPLKGTDRLEPDQKRLIIKKDTLQKWQKEAFQKWKPARRDFQQKKQKVEELIEQRQKISELVRYHTELTEEYRQVKAIFRETEQFSLKKEEIYVEIQQNIYKFEQKYDRQKHYWEAINLNKPSCFARLFNTKKARKYQQKKKAVQLELERLTREINNLENDQKKAEEDYQKAINKFTEAQQEEQKIRQKLDDIDIRLEKSKSILGDTFANKAWWERPNEQLQLSAPWVDVELNEARTQLFLSALAVHEQFIRNASEPFSVNLGRWVDVVKGKWGDLKDAQILYLWQTLFLVVPVISTTFASVQRLFNRLGTESLGWLLIDEAGQGTPQAAVGALQRAKRVVVVGDPLQIKPIVTLDPAIVEGLRQYFGVDECWSPNKSSIQSLCDRTNSYGTTIEINKEPLWIGCPLWVHRRCIDPMFTIANEIAYDNKMVVASKLPSLEQNFVLGESSWIDIDGSCQGKHWVPEQGEEIIKLLKQIVEQEQILPSLYIISPFRAVTARMKNLLRQKKNQWAREIKPDDLKQWIKQSVGTVHTFQGKETDSVILLLGTDKNSQGAAQWASEEPNILNVATTRAKYRFYIVGSKDLWSKLNYFETAYQQLNKK